MGVLDQADAELPRVQREEDAEGLCLLAEE